MRSFVEEERVEMIKNIANNQIEEKLHRSFQKIKPDSGFVEKLRQSLSRTPIISVKSDPSLLIIVFIGIGLFLGIGILRVVIRFFKKFHQD